MFLINHTHTHYDLELGYPGEDSKIHLLFFFFARFVCVGRKSRVCYEQFSVVGSLKSGSKGTGATGGGGGGIINLYCMSLGPFAFCMLSLYQPIMMLPLLVGQGGAGMDS